VNYDPTYEPQLSGGAIVALVLVYAVFIGFIVWMYVRIIRRAGYSGWWVLMGLVPIGNLIMLGFFAFKEWPIRRELEYLRRHAAMTGLPGYAPGPPQHGYGQGGQPYNPPHPNPPTP
jgi:hypothetical protein